MLNCKIFVVENKEQFMMAEVAIETKEYDLIFLVEKHFSRINVLIKNSVLEGCRNGQFVYCDSRPLSPDWGSPVKLKWGDNPAFPGIVDYGDEIHCKPEWIYKNYRTAFNGYYPANMYFREIREIIAIVGVAINQIKIS